MDDIKSSVHKIIGRPDKIDRPLQRPSLTSADIYNEGLSDIHEEIIINVDPSTTKYCIPADDTEQDRLLNTHYIIKHCFGSNFSVPISNILSKSISVAADTPGTEFNFDENHSTMNIPGSIPDYFTHRKAPTPTSFIKNHKFNSVPRVLDIACGSGIWILEMSTEFPNAQFYGIDCATIFPNTIKPPNAHFKQCDILDPNGLPFPDEHFDYVHMRLVYNCFSSPDLKFIFKEINRILKPSGYVELRDIDPVIRNPGPSANSIFSTCKQKMAETYSVDVTWTQQMCELLSSEAEMTDIHHQVISIGFGNEGPLADAFYQNIKDAMISHKKFFSDAYNMNPEQFEGVIDAIMKEGETHQSYFNYYMSWGRKPLVPLKEQRSGGINIRHPFLPMTSTPENSKSLKTQTCDDSSDNTLAKSLLVNAFDIYNFSDGYIE
ncbi:hypothetical protein BDB01DRAFT_723256 [Pilobolus umbonatus]|nr:hypothetical protein BDB01DRAFT_723256 [Pilobolus umbonatus]